jgi:hypothetical protein
VNTGGQPRHQQLTLAQEIRLKGLSRELKRLARLVEERNSCVAQLIIGVIDLLTDVNRKNYSDLTVADQLLTYLERRKIPCSQINAIIDLMERHGNVVFMKHTSGRFHRPAPAPRDPRQRKQFDSNLAAKELHESNALAGLWSITTKSEAALFDLSTRRKTMRATKYAK